MPAASFFSTPHERTPTQQLPRSGKPSGACAKLITANKAGKREALLLHVDCSLTIGRHPSCAYVVPDIVVSSLHCKLQAIKSSDGGIILSCQDFSTNGLILNGHKIRKTSVILMDGDVIEIPHSQKFECFLLEKPSASKTHIFDPTPPRDRSLKTKRIDHYLVTSHCLGSGSFATVHLAMDTREHRQVACKSIKRKNNDKIDKIMKEVNILLGLKHPNINRVWAASFNESFLHIFLELCTGGDLFSYIVSHPNTRLCEGETKYIMYQLMKALQYLHDKLISHRDLKPENILLHSPGPYPRIQIADFGLARPKAYQETFNVCGTVSYLPPEGILALDHKHLGYVGLSADCWSAGVIMYIMLAGGHPFDYDKQPGESQWYSYAQSEVLDDDPCSQPTYTQNSAQTDCMVKKRIVHCDPEFPKTIWHSMPHAAALCSHLLLYDARERATVLQALQNVWFSSELPELDAAYAERIGSI